MIYSGFSWIFPMKIMIFHSYVELSEGILRYIFSTELYGKNHIAINHYLYKVNPGFLWTIFSQLYISPQRSNPGNRELFPAGLCGPCCLSATGRTGRVISGRCCCSVSKMTSLQCQHGWWKFVDGGFPSVSLPQGKAIRDPCLLSRKI